MKVELVKEMQFTPIKIEIVFESKEDVKTFLKMTTYSQKSEKDFSEIVNYLSAKSE